MQNLILLPGTGCDAEFWQYQIEYLNDIANAKVILLDKESSLDEMVDTVLTEAPKKFSLAGHSQGGWVAQAVAAKAPERLETLFLMQTFTQQPAEFWKGMALWVERIKNGELEQILDQEMLPIVFHADKLTDHELVKRHQRMKKRLSADVYIRQMQAMLNHPSVFNYLSQIKAPTLIIAGREDIACNLAQHELMQQHIKNSALTIIEKCGHMACLEQPEAVTALMRLWLTMKYS